MRWWLVVAALGGCTGDKSSSQSGDTSSTGSTPAAATFTEVNDQVLTVTCGALSGCHSATDQNGFALSPGGEYDALVNVASTAGTVYVLPGDSDGSYVVQKMEGASGITGTPMPPAFGADPDSIALVRSWIDAGALNN